MNLFNKILIANRGEIACRVIRTCRELGIRTVAVYSEADDSAPHVHMADEAYLIGNAQPKDSYLDMAKIINVARACQVDGIHPGYGFLSESPVFAEAVAAAGIIFIGPPPSAIRALGTKTAARSLLKDTDVPVVPWAHVSTTDFDLAAGAAAEMGYPVVVKPSAGGGGIGTSVVESHAELRRSIELAGATAARYFGQPSVHLEKFIGMARHIETQVMIDSDGNAFAFPERECSMQRRFQKVIEESPSVAVSPLIRRRMAEAAIKVMKVGGYKNIGTVEFLLDAQNNFYFLEVNSRIQVEHPVTEMVTGLDMVDLQLRIASGNRFTLKPDSLNVKGHAIEARIYAEDPDTLMPTGGQITGYSEPVGKSVRVESGVAAGYSVTHYYDPLMAKLIAWGESREEATKRMRAALAEYRIEGVTTNIPLLRRIFNSPQFIQGEYHTGTLSQELLPVPAASGQS
jgi:acetyl/propionyl-CoA carboxylase alpha subunit